MIVVRSKVAVDAIPAGTMSQNVEVFVGDQCFMVQYGEALQGYCHLPNASFSSSDETLLKMPVDWVVPHVYRSYQVVRWLAEGLNSQHQHSHPKVWYQEESQGIYRVEEQELEEELGAVQQVPQEQRGRPRQQQQGPRRPQREQRLPSLQVKTMTRNVTIPLTVPK